MVFAALRLIFSVFFSVYTYFLKMPYHIYCTGMVPRQCVLRWFIKLVISKKIYHNVNIDMVSPQCYMPNMSSTM